MPAQVFGRAVNDQIRTEGDRILIDRGCEGVVHDRRRADFLRGLEILSKFDLTYDLLHVGYSLCDIKSAIRSRVRLARDGSRPSVKTETVTPSRVSKAPKITCERSADEASHTSDP